MKNIFEGISLWKKRKSHANRSLFSGMGGLQWRVGCKLVALFSCFASLFRSVPNLFYFWRPARNVEQLQRHAQAGEKDSPNPVGWTEEVKREAELGVLEVEQKFHCTDALLQKLGQLSYVECQNRFTDVYFDTIDFSLTKKDIWLRSRDGHLELKVPHNIQETSVNLYMEISKHNEIATLLKSSEIHVPFDQRISSAQLAKVGVQPFAEIETCRTRRKIQLDANTTEIPCSRFAVFVDIDEVKFLEESVQTSENYYVIGEVELDSESVKTLSTTHKIQLLRCALKTLGITATSPPSGKVEEFLRKYRPTHYEALQVAGILAA
eukprot:s2575_g9.t1